MEDIKVITASSRPIEEIIKDLKLKSITIPAWEDLEKEYDPKRHPVMADSSYIDKVTNVGIEKVTRITLGLQRLATKRMTELIFGIPVKRVYTAVTEGEKVVAKVMEKIFEKNRIDPLNIERGNMLFSGCEVVTLWYAIEEKNNLYGIDSNIKLRCKNYSPKNLDTLYPLFDDYDDMIALSFGYTRKSGASTTEYFDTFTKEEHIRWQKTSEGWQEVIRESISLGKIPGIYISRPTPIWEDTSNNVFECEWSVSRNGNYLRKNSKPLFALFADEEIRFGGEKSDESRTVLQYPKGSTANYITWNQAIESLKFQIETLTAWFFMELQLPEFSFSSMARTPMSADSRKMVFIDAQLKVTDEAGRWIEAMDREVNIVRAFMKTLMPSNFAKDIDTLVVEIQITPFSITDDKDIIQNLSTATGGKPIMSQKEAVNMLGWSADVEETLKQLQDEAMADLTQPTI